MLSFTDQIGTTVNLSKFPERIVSLVPSQTELLSDLGLDKEVAGITKFCIRPARWFKSKPRVGGTKTVDIQRIKDLQPDLIIANKEENVHDQVEQLQQVAPVWVSNIETLEDALKMITEIGSLTKRHEKAFHLASDIENGFAQLQTSFAAPGKITTAYLIWQNPYMTAGSGTFIHDMLNRCGFENVFKHKKRYPVITVEELASANCELLLLSSEPYPFTQKHVNELHHQLPETAILLVNGEMFSWYGSRLLHAVPYFRKLMDIVSNQLLLSNKKSTRP